MNDQSTQTKKDEVAKEQNKIAQNSEIKAAEANKQAAMEHKKQSDKQMDKSNS